MNSSRTSRSRLRQSTNLSMRLSISLREDTERDVVRVSLRSVDDFPCNRMAEEFFHGGGHLNASGGELPFPLSEAMLTAERAIKAYADLL